MVQPIWVLLNKQRLNITKTKNQEIFIVHNIIIITIYFENAHFSHAKFGLGDLPIIKSFHTSLNIAHSSSRPSKSMCLLTQNKSPQVFLPLPLQFHPDPPPFFCRPTPNHRHSYAQDAFTISISIKSIQLHGSIVMALPWDSISYITLHFITASHIWNEIPWHF